MAPAALVSNVAPSAVTGPAPRKPLVQPKKPQSLIDGAQLTEVADRSMNPTEQKESTSDELSSVAWYYDSLPFICVTMLPDCTGMVGRETALRTAIRDAMKVHKPTMRTTVVMQGRYTKPQALKVLGGGEHISMVTSSWPKSPFIKDETVLTRNQQLI